MQHLENRFLRIFWLYIGGAIACLVAYVFYRSERKRIEFKNFVIDELDFTNSRISNIVDQKRKSQKDVAKG